MEDTNVKLTLDLGNKALAQMARMSKHHIAMVWDLGPNVTLGFKYLAGSVLIWKSLESVTKILVAWISRPSPSPPPASPSRQSPANQP